MTVISRPCENVHKKLMFFFFIKSVRCALLCMKTCVLLRDVRLSSLYVKVWQTYQLTFILKFIILVRNRKLWELPFYLRNFMPRFLQKKIVKGFYVKMFLMTYLRFQTRIQIFIPNLDFQNHYCKIESTEFEILKKLYY